MSRCWDQEVGAGLLKVSEKWRETARIKNDSEGPTNAQRWSENPQQHLEISPIALTFAHHRWQKQHHCLSIAHSQRPSCPCLYQASIPPSFPSSKASRPLHSSTNPHHLPGSWSDPYSLVWCERCNRERWEWRGIRWRSAQDDKNVRVRRQCIRECYDAHWRQGSQS